MTDDDEQTRLVRKVPAAEPAGELDETTRLVQREIPDDATRLVTRVEPVDDATRLVARVQPDELDDATRVVRGTDGPADLDDRTRVVRGSEPDDATNYVRGSRPDDRTALAPKTVAAPAADGIPVQIPNGRQAFVPGGVSDAPADRYEIRTPETPAPSVKRTPSEPEQSRRTPTRTRTRRGPAVIIVVVAVTVVVAAVVVGIALVLLGIVP